MDNRTVAKAGRMRGSVGWLGAGLILVAAAVPGRPALTAPVAAPGAPAMLVQAPRLVVLDLPYERVWEATLRALAGYPIERAGDGVVVLGRVERAPRADEVGFTRVAERVTVRLDGFGPGSTRIAVEVVAQGLRDGTWTAVPSTETTAREILDRIRAAQG